MRPRNRLGGKIEDRPARRGPREDIANPESASTVSFPILLEHGGAAAAKLNCYPITHHPGTIAAMPARRHICQKDVPIINFNRYLWIRLTRKVCPHRDTPAAAPPAPLSSEPKYSLSFSLKAQLKRHKGSLLIPISRPDMYPLFTLLALMAGHPASHSSLPRELPLPPWVLCNPMPPRKEGAGRCPGRAGPFAPALRWPAVCVLQG